MEIWQAVLLYVYMVFVTAIAINRTATGTSGARCFFAGILWFIWIPIFIIGALIKASEE